MSRSKKSKKKNLDKYKISQKNIEKYNEMKLKIFGEASSPKPKRSDRNESSNQRPNLKPTFIKPRRNPPNNHSHSSSHHDTPSRTNSIRKYNKLKANIFAQNRGNSHHYPNKTQKSSFNSPNDYRSNRSQTQYHRQPQRNYGKAADDHYVNRSRTQYQPKPRRKSHKASDDHYIQRSRNHQYKPRENNENHSINLKSSTPRAKWKVKDKSNGTKKAESNVTAKAIGTKPKGRSKDTSCIKQNRNYNPQKNHSYYNNDKSYFLNKRKMHQQMVHDEPSTTHFRSHPPTRSPNKRYNPFLSERAQKEGDAVLKEMKHFNQEQEVNDWWEHSEICNETQQETAEIKNGVTGDDFADKNGDKSVSPKDKSVSPSKDSLKSKSSSVSADKDAESPCIDKQEISHYIARRHAQKMMNQYHAPPPVISTQIKEPEIDEEYIEKVYSKIKRKAWKIGSYVEVYSVSNGSWTKGKIIKISKHIYDAYDDGKWRCGSLVQIYSHSKHEWLNGKIISISGKWIEVQYDEYTKKVKTNSKDIKPLDDHDTDGQWLTVIYGDKQKILSRFDEHIKPIINGDIETKKKMRECALEFIAKNKDENDDINEHKMQYPPFIMDPHVMNMFGNPDFELPDTNIFQNNAIFGNVVPHNLVCWEFNSVKGCKKGAKCKWKHEYYGVQMPHPLTGEILDGNKIKELREKEIDIKTNGTEIKREIVVDKTETIKKENS